MRTSIAFLAMGAGVLLYTYASIVTHHLHWHNNKSTIGASAILGIVLLLIGLILHLM